MKNRIFAVLLVAVLVSVSAVAQQTASTSTQAATPAATMAQNATGKQPLTVETKEGFWGKINPFARKKYVQRQLHPVADRLNELDELTATNTKNIRDVDGRATEGIRLAASKANEADQHAIDAGNRANAAQATAQQANTRLSTVETAVGNIDQYKPITQTEIHFKPGQTVLSKNAKEALDGMATTLKTQRGYVVEVQGFSAGHGQTAISNSQKMADAVVRYLVLNHEIPVYRIFVVGMGNAPKTDADGKAIRITGGRVEVSLLKNNLDQLAAADQLQAK